MKTLLEAGAGDRLVQNFNGKMTKKHRLFVKKISDRRGAAC
jgi:hypothetical protein